MERSGNNHFNQGINIISSNGKRYTMSSYLMYTILVTNRVINHLLKVHHILLFDVYNFSYE